MPEPAPLHITTRSGKVRVDASAGTELSIEGGRAETHDDGTVHIRREPSSGTIVVQCASGTDVTVGTVSGNVDLLGGLGAVRVATVSGRIRVEDVARIDVRTKSGKIDIGTCTGDCRITTKSSAVHVTSAGRATVAAVSGVVVLENVRGAEVKTVTGKVLIGAEGGDRIAVHTVSGHVAIRLPAQTKPATRLRSVSGRIRCDLASGDDFVVSVSSVSGAIEVLGG